MEETEQLLPATVCEPRRTAAASEGGLGFDAFRFDFFQILSLKNDKTMIVLF